MLNVLIVDDEVPAHEVLLHHCRTHADINVAGRCYNAAEALAAIATERVDLMFLDIRMPRFGGLDLLRGLYAPPLTVIVSAHKEHALDGFDLDVVDYLLKPVSAMRFAAALDKARRRLASDRVENGKTQQDLVLKVDRTMRRFRFDEIACFQAQGNFVQVWTQAGVVLASTTMRRLLELLPADRFVQIHRSHIVNCSYIAEHDAGSVRLDNGMQAPIGKNFRGRSLLHR